MSDLNVPLACGKDNGDWCVVIACKGGASTHPDWYYNVIAIPQVTVEVGTETFQAQAIGAEEPERTRLYDKMVKVHAGFEGYSRNTVCKIPVIGLIPMK